MACCRAKDVLSNNVKHRLYKVSSENDADLLYSIKLWVARNAVKLLVNELKCAHSAHAEPLVCGACLVRLSDGVASDYAVRRLNDHKRAVCDVMEVDANCLLELCLLGLLQGPLKVRVLLDDVCKH